MLGWESKEIIFVEHLALYQVHVKCSIKFPLIIIIYLLSTDRIILNNFIKVLLTYNKLHILKVYNLKGFNVSIHSWNYHHNQKIVNMSIIPKVSSWTFVILPLYPFHLFQPPLHFQVNTNLFCITILLTKFWLFATLHY